jgi:2-hydroxychromene-2-carboxylate isomerase
MAKTFEFLFDVGAPNGYLVHKIMPAFATETGATPVYVPVLIGGLFKATGNRPPLMRYADSPAKWAYEQREFDRFVRANGISAYRLNPHFPVNTLLAMRGAVAAARAGVLMPYVDATMAAMWEDGAKLDEPDVLTTVLDAAGLDGAALVAAAGDADVKAELAANTERAVARGAFGIPTFFVGEEIFWGKERLAQVKAAIAAVGDGS